MTNKLSAKDFINLYQNPLKPQKLPGSKDSVPNETVEEIVLKRESLNTLREIVSFSRIDRRNSRLAAQWNEQDQIAKISRHVGNISSQYGYEDHGQLFLFPEEIFLLLQNNKLELLWNGLPLSVEQACYILFKSKGHFNNYKAFQELSLRGYKVRTPLALNKRKHLNADDVDDVARKKTKACVRTKDDNETISLYEQLKREGPTNLNYESNGPSSYHVFSPNASPRSQRPDNAIICRSSEHRLSMQCISGSSYPFLTALIDAQPVSFYKFYKININK